MINLLNEIPGYNDTGVTAYRLDNYFGAYRLHNDVAEAFNFATNKWEANGFSKKEFKDHLDSKEATKDNRCFRNYQINRSIWIPPIRFWISPTLPYAKISN